MRIYYRETRHLRTPRLEDGAGHYEGSEPGTGSPSSARCSVSDGLSGPRLLLTVRCPGSSADLVYIQQDKEGCPADLSLPVLPGLLSPEPTALWATF